MTVRIVYDQYCCRFLHSVLSTVHQAYIKYIYHASLDANSNNLSLSGTESRYGCRSRDILEDILDAELCGFIELLVAAGRDGCEKEAREGGSVIVAGIYLGYAF